MLKSTQKSVNGRSGRKKNTGKSVHREKSVSVFNTPSRTPSNGSRPHTSGGEILISEKNENISTIDPKLFRTSILKDYIMKKRNKVMADKRAENLRNIRARKISAIIEEKMSTESENLYSAKVTPKRSSVDSKGLKFVFGETERNSKPNSIVVTPRRTPQVTPRGTPRRPIDETKRGFTFRDNTKSRERRVSPP